jgi:hypothetical protein
MLMRGASTGDEDSLVNNPQASVPRSSRLGLVLLLVGILGTAANYAAGVVFPLKWGGPNIGAGMLQMLFYGVLVAGVVIIVSGRIKRGR